MRRAPGFVGCATTSMDDLARTVVAAASFLEHHPDAPFVIAVCHPLPAVRELVDPRIELRSVSELSIPSVGWKGLLCSVEPAAAPLVVRPHLVRALLDEHASVLLLDPSTFAVTDVDPRARPLAVWAGCMRFDRRSVGFLEWWAERSFAEAPHRPAAPLDRPGPPDPMDAALGTLAPVLRQVLHYDTVRALERGTELPPTPLDADGQRFRAWLGSTSDTPGGVPLVAYALWCSRTGLDEAFADLTDPDQRRRFLVWARSHAAAEHPEIDWSILDAAIAQPTTRVRVAAEPFGVDVVGYFSGQFGLGEAGRRLTTALRSAGVPVSTVAYRRSDQPPWDGHRTDDVFRYDTVILSVNAPETSAAQAELQAQLHDRHLIGYWHWEVLDSLPPEHRAAIGVVDEIWAPSTFVADLFEPHAPGRTYAMPYPLSVPLPGTRLSRAEVGFDDRFTFLFVFDFFSGGQRKNPQALVSAFRLAFRDGEGPALVLKSVNGCQEGVAGELDALRWAARDRTDIVITDRMVQPQVVQSMIEACDCYVSLHRSEGVGSTISDAMAAGRPAIATRFSGNLEFMTDTNSYLVDTRCLSRVGPGNTQGFPEDGIWAEPDIDHAASLLREVFDRQEVAAQRGAEAAADLAIRFSPEATGARMRDRLEAIWAQRSGWADVGTKGAGPTARGRRSPRRTGWR